MARKAKPFEGPTVFAICSGRCCQRGVGAKVGRFVGFEFVGTYYGRAYTPAKWAKGPTCENCGSPMKELYRVEAAA